MWTPKRIVLLVCGFVLFFGVYVAYGATYVGRIDGLPPLPEALWPDPGVQFVAPPEHKPNPLDAKLRLAFGPKCKEQNWPIRLELHARNMVLAASEFRVLKDGRVYLAPLSVAVFGKPKGDGRPDEFNTIRGEMAYLTFDRPISNIQEISGRKIVTAELRNRIAVINNRRRLQRDEDLEVRIAAGPLYYSEPKHQIWTDDYLQLIDRKPKPRPSEVKGKGMLMDLQTEAHEAPPRPGAPPRKPKGESITGVKHIVLHGAVDMTLYLDGRSGFLGGPKPAQPPTAAAPPAARDELRIRTPGAFHYDVFKDHDLARFDVPALDPAKKLRSPEHVVVVRKNDAFKAGQDTLVCQHLELRLCRKEAAHATPGAAAPPAPRPGEAHTQDQALEVETAHATASGAGKEVTLTSDAEKLVARGKDFYYDARRLLTVLKGEPEMEATKDGSIIVARELQIEEIKSPPAGPAPAAPPGAAGAGKSADKGYQKITAKGPGHIHMLDKATEKRTTHAYWQDLLTSAKDFPHDLLTLTGQARFVDDQNDQALNADVIKVWLEPAEKEPEGGTPAVKPVADKGNNAGGPPQSRRPHHVEATGNVVVRSKDLNVHETSRFVVWFKDVPAEQLLPAAPAETGASPGTAARPAPAPAVAAPAPAAAPAAPPPSPAAPAAPPPVAPPPDAGRLPAPLPRGPVEPGRLVSKPGERTAPAGPALGGPGLLNGGTRADGQPPRPIDLSARSVEAHVLRSPAKSTLDQLRAEGEVKVHQEPAKPDEKATDIEGDELNLTGDPDGNFLVVRGDLAILCMDKIQIFGPEVNIDQKTDKAWVIGVGAMKMESKTNFQGGNLDKSVPLTVHWNKSMLFNGKSAEFHGGIQAEQENARLACQRLQVYFDRPISLKQGNKSEEPAKVREMVRDRDVRIEDRLYEGDKLVEYKRLIAPGVQMNALEPDETGPRKPPVAGAGPAGKSSDGNEVHASGPGYVQIVKRGGPDPLAPPPPAVAPGRPGTPARPSPAPAPTARGTKPAGAAPKEDELKLTYVSFRKRMDANSRTNTALFWENVRVLNLPCDNPNQVIDLDAVLAGDLPEGGMYLSCDRLKVLDQPENGRPNQQMEAYGRVYVQGKDYYARADAVFYNQAKDQIILDGKDSGQATLYKVAHRGAKPEELRGRKIIYSRTNGKADVIDGSEVNGSSPGRATPPPPASPGTAPGPAAKPAPGTR